MAHAYLLLAAPLKTHFPTCLQEFLKIIDLKQRVYELSDPPAQKFFNFIYANKLRRRRREQGLN